MGISESKNEVLLNYPDAQLGNITWKKQLVRKTAI